MAFQCLHCGRPAIIEPASPYDEFPFEQERTRPAKPELLQALWAAYPAAVFSRAELLLDNYDECRSAFRLLRDALVEAFEDSPEEIDALVQEYISASDKRSKAQAYKIYESALRYRHDDPPIPPSSRMHRVAFQRLLWAARRRKAKRF